MKKLDGFSLALVGAGNMGGALLSGWLARGLPVSAVSVIDPNAPEAVRSTGVRVLSDAAGSVPVGVLVLAIKPQLFADVLPRLLPLCGPATVVVSVAAGQTVASIGRGLGHAGAIVRTMPNTPALIGRGVTGAFANAACTQDQKALVNALLEAVGKVAWVEDEGLIDAVTAVSGSGPAYVFHLVEAMAEAGRKAGLPADLAMLLARETVSGAGELLARSSEPASRLRENVTSPKGTTAAALEVLMGEGGLTPLMERAIAAAKRRAQELAGG
jgi:pyrroline-5-carboxylate reductase